MVRRTVSILLALSVVLPIAVKQHSPTLAAAIDKGGSASLNRASYFRTQTGLLQQQCLNGIKTKSDWDTRRITLRRELLDMFGLDPMPPRTELQPFVTGRTETEDITVENLHFQSRPGLYVTANLYLPKNMSSQVPAVLYVCGHAGVKDGDTSFGNKVHYQHHGVWFAQHGIACLMIDSLQLGEIEATHHGTYRYKMWWWNNRGYSPAGVEAWNCIRALDYLQSREEIDPERLGVTGRSGGGAYSWFVAAVDDRIKATVPVAGITDLQNHVVDGTVEGHCDCMFFANTYRWDYPALAALVAPRPLLISNSDRDGIFPLDGVMRTYNKTRQIYELHDAGERLGLQITAGTHRDTQELRVHAFRWFNTHLASKPDVLIDRPAVKLFEPPQLQVFRDGLPKDQKNTTIHESFVPLADTPKVPDSLAAWKIDRDRWREQLLEKSFRGWPSKAVPLDTHLAFRSEHDGLTLSAFDFTSQKDVPLRFFTVWRSEIKEPSLTIVHVLDEQGWNEMRAVWQDAFGKRFASANKPASNKDTYAKHRQTLQSRDWAYVYVMPRGVGPTAWESDERIQTQIRRRFMLLGQTLDGMRVWDVRRAIKATRTIARLSESTVWLKSSRQMSGITLYASLFESDIARLGLAHLSRDHRGGPYFLNVRRYLNMPQAVAMAAERSGLMLYQDTADGWEYPQAVSSALGWDDDRIQVRTLEGE